MGSQGSNTRQVAALEVEQQGQELVPTWDAGFADSHLIHEATMLAPTSLVLNSNFVPSRLTHLNSLET